MKKKGTLAAKIFLLVGITIMATGSIYLLIQGLARNETIFFLIILLFSPICAVYAITLIGICIRNIFKKTHWIRSNVYTVLLCCVLLASVMVFWAMIFFQLVKVT